MSERSIWFKYIQIFGIKIQMFQILYDNSLSICLKVKKIYRLLSDRSCKETSKHIKRIRASISVLWYLVWYKPLLCVKGAFGTLRKYVHYALLELWCILEHDLFVFLCICICVVWSIMHFCSTYCFRYSDV